MAVRNFWVDVTVDGRETVLSGGPRAKDGGMVTRFYIRNAGESYHALTVQCDMIDNGDGDVLTIKVAPSDQVAVHEFSGGFKIIANR